MNVHIDVLSAQTGISRFLEINRDSGWIYNKSENLIPGSSDMLQFTHLLVEAESESDPRIKQYGSTHLIQYFASAFNGLDFSKSISNKYPFLLSIPKFRYVPKIFILKRIQYSKT